MAMYTPPTGIGQALHLLFAGASHAVRYIKSFGTV